MTTKHLAILTAALALAFTAGCHNKERAALNGLEKDRFLVKTEKAAARDMQEEILLTGSAKAKDEAVLYPRVAGKLLKNLLNEGDPVTKDQPVALIERDEVGVVFEPAPVPSTLTGVVGRIYQDVGANLTMETPIALIVSQKEVRVQVDLPERYLGRIYLGQPATVSVEAFPNRTFYGKVYKISPVVDSANRTVPIEVLVDNSQNMLKSGMFTQVKLIVGSAQGALSVPLAAVQEDNGESFVFVPQNGQASKRKVTVGIKTMNYAQIKSGLRAGEEVISSGLYGLKDGDKLEISQDK
jgi:multidrug efflux pump subunit AcrA (membrane-fusion protein)